MKTKQFLWEFPVRLSKLSKKDQSSYRYESFCKMKSEIYKPSTSFLFILGWYLAYTFLNPGFAWFETPTYELIMNIIRTKSIASESQLPGGVFFQAPNGLFYDAHDIGATLFSLPVAWATYLIISLLGLVSTTKHLALTCGFLGPLCMAVSLYFFFITLVRFYNCTPWHAFLSSLVLGTATQVMVYSGSPSDITVSTMLLMMLFFYLKLFLEEKRLACLLFAFFISAFLMITRITTAPVFLLVLVSILAARDIPRILKIKGLMAAFLILLPALVWLVYYNYVRTGHPLISPLTNNDAGRLDFSYYRESLVGTIFSPSKGLLIFNPMLVFLPFALIRHRSLLRLEIAFILLLFFGTLVRTGAMKQWTGGGGWGARYYTYMIPLFFIPIGIMIDRCFTDKRLVKKVIILWIIGFLINAAAMLTNWHYRQSLLGRRLVPWSLYGQPVDAVVGLVKNFLRLLGMNIPLEIVDGASRANILASNSINVWWLNVRYFGVPLSICILVGVVQVIFVFVIFRKVLRAIN